MSYSIVRRCHATDDLRATGDWRVYCARVHAAAEQSGSMPYPLHVRCHLLQYYGQAAESLNIPAMGYSLLLGLPVWGKRYAEAFAAHSLPSLLEDDMKDCLLLVQCDNAAWDVLSSGGIARLPNVTRIALPEQLMSCVSGELRYWALGVLQSHQLAIARRMGAGFHAMHPDCVYARGYFSRLLAMGKECVLQTSIRTRMETISPHIAVMDPGSLMQLGMEHLHPCFGGLFSDWPKATLRFWASEGRLCYASPHLSPAYLSPELVQRIPERLYFTFDSELEHLLPEGADVYHAQAEDGLAYIEMTAGGEPGFETGDLRGFCRTFWARIMTVPAARYFRTMGSVAVKGMDGGEPNHAEAVAALDEYYASHTPVPLY